MRSVAVVCVLSCACGGDSQPPPEPISVRVTRGDFPAPGITAWFQTADNTVVLETTTDDQGDAIAYMDDGGTVTLLDPLVDVLDEPFLHTLYTIAGVERGDELVVHSTAGISAPPRMRIIPPQHPQAMEYYVYSSCTSDEIDATAMNLFAGCRASETLVIAAGGGMPPVLFAAATFDNVPIVDGSTFDGSTGTYQPFVSIPYRIANPPADAVLFAPERYFLETRTILPVLNVPSGPFDGELRTSRPDDRPVIVGGGVVNSSGDIYQTLHEWGAIEADTLDGTHLLAAPIVTPTVEPANNRIVWSFPDDRDVVIASFSCMRASARWQWTIAAPYARDFLKLPVLPNDASKFNLTADAECNATLLRFARVTGGYDAVRETIHLQDELRFVVGDSGRAALQFVAQ